MQYQSFRGADLKEALSVVKAALGPNALIESTRHVSNGRAGGLGQSYVEVTAASAVPIKWPFAEARPRPSESPNRRPRNSGSASSQAHKGALRMQDDIERELSTLKRMLDELNESRPPRDRALTLLHAAGIDGALARELAAGATKTARRPGPALRAWLMERIRERLRVSPGMISDPEPTVITCVGPTGVGKTTTLAKLAARARLDHGRSVGVISLDTFRVGAIEQWQRYAQLMGVPFQVASDMHSFARALASMQTDLVLVDTAGQSVHGTSWPLGRCLGAISDRRVRVLLVMPAWLRSGDVERVLRVYDDPVPTELVVSKLDETYQVGGVLHAALPNQIPIAYLCNGPRVPEDILEASTDGVLDAVFPSEL